MDKAFDNDANRFAARLRISNAELAVACGLTPSAMSSKAPAAQSRLREVAEIVTQVFPWAGSATLAFAWYRAQPLPPFGRRTAEDLVKDGLASAVKVYLDRICDGGYA
jgi:hypothetical protein